MRASTADHDSLNWLAAADARFIGPMVDFQTMLMTARLPLNITVAPVVERGAPILDRLLQHPADRGIKALGVLVRQRVCLAQRAQAGLEQHLIRVDIAQTCHKRLIEQQRLECPCVPGQLRGEEIQGELSRQRLRAEMAYHRLEIARQVHTTELAWVVKDQLATISQVEDNAGVLAWLDLLWLHSQLPTHAEVDQQLAGRGQKEDQKLGSPAHTLDPTAWQPRGEFTLRWHGH